MSCIQCMKDALHIKFSIYLFPSMQCMCQFSIYPQNVNFAFKQDKKETVQFIPTAKYQHSAWIYMLVKNGLCGLVLVLLSNPFLSQSLMKRPDGNISIPWTYQQGCLSVCGCEEFSALMNGSLSVMMMITPTNFAWTILLRLLPFYPVIFSYLSPSHQRS